MPAATRQKIEVENIHPNPLNPRRAYHLDEKDEDLVALALSLQETGQRDPATVYEMLPDLPGQFMLLRGHRRHGAACLAQVPLLDCNVIPRPATKREELGWLGSEEALKLDWGRFTKLRYARDIAIEHGMQLMDRQLTSLTGVPKAHLETAAYLFSLEPEIIEHVALWEEWDYHNRDKDKKSPVPHSNLGIRIGKFTPERAAQVYRLFRILRDEFSDMPSVSGLNDLELQARIAANTNSNSINELKDTFAAIQSIKYSNKPGDIITLNNLLREGQTSGRAARNVTSAAKNKYEQLLARHVNRADSMTNELRLLATYGNELGSNVELLLEAQADFARLELALNKLGAVVTKKIRQLKS